MSSLPRPLAVLLATLALGGSVAACGSNDTGASDGGTGADSQRNDRAGDRSGGQSNPAGTVPER